jgi:hypothetical protein
LNVNIPPHPTPHHPKKVLFTGKQKYAQDKVEEKIQNQEKYQKKDTKARG